MLVAINALNGEEVKAKELRYLPREEWPPFICGGRTPDGRLCEGQSSGAVPKKATSRCYFSSRHHAPGCENKSIQEQHSVDGHYDGTTRTRTETRGVPLTILRLPKKIPSTGAPSTRPNGGVRAMARAVPSLSGESSSSYEQERTLGSILHRILDNLLDWGAPLQLPDGTESTFSALVHRAETIPDLPMGTKGLFYGLIDYPNRWYGHYYLNFQSVHAAIWVDEEHVDEVEATLKTSLADLRGYNAIAYGTITGGKTNPRVLVKDNALSVRKTPRSHSNTLPV